jgi:hypothetical protein
VSADVREPDEVLAELGADLRRAWASPPRRRARRAPRRAVLAVALALVLVPTAVATRDAVWAPAPPAPPGVTPSARAGAAVYVAAGRDAGVAWRLSATSCDYGGTRAIGLFLDVPGGGGGARCDVGAAPPAAAAARRVSTYFDPEAELTWVFGALPARAAAVDVAGRRVGARPASREALTTGGLPAGLQVFVVALRGARDVPDVRVLDRDGDVLSTCRDGRCRP